MNVGDVLFFFVFFLKKNNEIALQTVKARDAAVMRISSSGGAQPAAIQMNGAADNSANSSRAIILHASGPEDYFSYRTKPCSLTISCCRSPLPSAVPIICWQQLVSSVRQSVGLLTSL